MQAALTPLIDLLDSQPQLYSALNEMFLAFKADPAALSQFQLFDEHMRTFVEYFQFGG